MVIIVIIFPFLSGPEERPLEQTVSHRYTPSLPLEHTVSYRYTHSLPLCPSEQMDSHGCLSSLFCIVCQNKWTVITTWVISSALSVRINGQSWLLALSLLHCPSDQMDRHGCLRYLFYIVRQIKWTDMTACVISSALSVRSNGPT